MKVSIDIEVSVDELAQILRGLTSAPKQERLVVRPKVVTRKKVSRRRKQVSSRVRWTGEEDDWLLATADMGRLPRDSVSRFYRKFGHKRSRQALYLRHRKLTGDN